MKAKGVSCRYCGGKTRAWHGSHSGFVICHDCTLVIREPMPSIDELARIHASYYSQENIRSGNTHMESSVPSLDNHAGFISTFIEPGKTVLDFGAGTGYLANVLRDAGYIVDGVEFSESASDAAQRQYGVSFYSSLEELKTAKDTSYDMIVTVEVIEHLREPWKELQLLYSLTRTGGRLYITTPNSRGLLARLQKANWREARKPFHLVLFSYSSLARLLRDCGFESVQSLRFSPLTTYSPKKLVLHRGLQLFALYGGLRVIAKKSVGPAS